MRPSIFYITCFIATLICGSQGFCQDNQDSSNLVKNIGKSEIIQDERVDALLKKHIALNEANPVMDGWRVQIKSFSGNNSKKDANDMKSSFLSKYPEMGAHIVFHSPNFKVRVGDFRTKLDAYKFYKDIKQEFPSSFIVKDEIDLPKID